MGISEIEVSLLPVEPSRLGDKGAYPIGYALSKSPSFCPGSSFELAAYGTSADSEPILVHRACGYRIGDYAVVADAYSPSEFRKSGLYAAFLQARIEYFNLIDHLDPERILMLHGPGPDHACQILRLGFVEARLMFAPPADLVRETVYRFTRPALTVMRSSSHFGGGMISFCGRRIRLNDRTVLRHVLHDRGMQTLIG